MSAPDFLVWRNLALIPCLVAVLWMLAGGLCREWVKRDLRNRLCRPVSVRWRCLASLGGICAFRVSYADLHGRIHRADARTDWPRSRLNRERGEIVSVRPGPRPGSTGD